MQIMATKRVKETTEKSIDTFETVYLVQTGETVEELLRRLKLTGTNEGHFSDAEVRLKLVKPPQ